MSDEMWDEGDEQAAPQLRASCLPPPGFNARSAYHLGRFVDFARGDPALTAWEEGFLASIARMLQKGEPKLGLSEKQVLVLGGLISKLGYGQQDD